MTDIAELHAQALDATGRIVDGVPAGGWHAATPCGDWDARALVNHLVSGNWWAAELAAGRTLEQAEPSRPSRTRTSQAGCSAIRAGPQ